MPKKILDQALQNKYALFLQRVLQRRLLEK